eukprot:TRINITY_DN7329_c1_g1_i1.p1 TRINITY_DN7329_c1_g1~~TRINITY_DN7329_c1_g1_i1.p1  ORF type:complete len:102 (-),score=12.90 TRINITY_DN7329_c1_g1_i1:131-436(-)
MRSCSQRLPNTGSLAANASSVQVLRNAKPSLSESEDEEGPRPCSVAVAAAAAAAHQHVPPIHTHIQRSSGGQHVGMRVLLLCSSGTMRHDGTPNCEMPKST